MFVLQRAEEPLDYAVGLWAPHPCADVTEQRVVAGERVSQQMCLLGLAALEELQPVPETIVDVEPPEPWQVTVGCDLHPSGGQT